ncbi:MAG: hypothetical protein Kow0069_38840 [Promethearchaeota archaeon]
MVSITEEAVVGKKGEILPKKRIRDLMNLRPGDRVLLEATGDRLVVRKVYSVRELLGMPAIEGGTPDEHKEIIREEAERR